MVYSSQMAKLQDRYRGCLLGLAVGDALGTTLEFKTPGSFTPLTDMVGGGPFQLTPGQWTDDTTAAVCGQLAGAFYGASQVPAGWLERLSLRLEITRLADRLLAKE